MPIMKFHSDRPDVFGADVDHGELGRKYEALMQDPAYLDQNHPRHMQVKGDVMALSEAMYGEKSVDGGQPFSGITVKTGPNAHDPFAANAWDPYNLGSATIADGKGTPDEHMFADHRPLK